MKPSKGLLDKFESERIARSGGKVAGGAGGKGGGATGAVQPQAGKDEAKDDDSPTTLQAPTGVQSPKPTPVVSGSELDVLKNRSDFEISSDIITDDGKTVNLEAVKKLCLAGRAAAVLRAAMKHIGDRAKLIAIINFLLLGGYIVYRDIMETDGNLFNEIQSLLIEN